jgi:hypothetical protein
MEVHHSFPLSLFFFFFLSFPMKNLSMGLLRSLNEERTNPIRGNCARLARLEKTLHDVSAVVAAISDFIGVLMYKVRIALLVFTILRVSSLISLGRGWFHERGATHITTTQASALLPNIRGPLALPSITLPPTGADLDQFLSQRFISYLYTNLFRSTSANKRPFVGQHDG